MKNLGRRLSKEEQKQVNGGSWDVAGRGCNNSLDCYKDHPFFGPGDVYCNNIFNGRNIGACQYW